MSIKVAISGDLGSGKSTVGKLFETNTGYKFHSAGSVYRCLAEEYGMTPVEFAKYSETHPEVDEEIDGKLMRISETDQNMIIDARMAWHFVKGAFKLHLLVEMEVAAKRIMDENRGSEKYPTIEDAIAKIKRRKQSENKRYTEKYNVNPDELSNYDLVVDTTYATSQEVYDFADKYFSLWKQNKKFDRVWTKKSGQWEMVK